MSTPPRIGRAPVNGLEMYYEIHGDGDPLVLVHGGVTGIHMFGGNVAAFAERRRVIAVELQGHGRTGDADRPMRYETLADDVAALVRHLGVAQADVMGVSLGGGVALQVAIRHPALVRRLVVVAAPYRADGWFPEVRRGQAEMADNGTAQQVAQGPLAQLYPDVDWTRLFAKLSEMLRSEYDWSAAVQRITAPVLLVFADADSVRPAHILDFYALLGGGLHDAGLDGSLRPASRLAVLPGRTHYDIAAAPELPAAVLPFLE